MKAAQKPKVDRGVRRAQALAFIKDRQSKKLQWGAKDVATALGISDAQAWSLLQSLTFTGELTRGSRTVVITDALITADSAA